MRREVQDSQDVEAHRRKNRGHAGKYDDRRRHLVFSAVH